MSKGILIIDMPKCCDECELYYENKNYSDTCIVGNFYIETDVLKEKPTWCPLNEVPQKKEPQTYKLSPMMDEHYTEYDKGYNACINDILEKVMNNEEG